MWNLLRLPMLRLPIMWDLPPLAHLPIAYCPLADGHLPLLLPPQNTQTSYRACLACRQSIPQKFFFLTLTVTWHSSHTYSETSLHICLGGGKVGLISSFWSIPPLQSVFLHTWRGKDTLTRPLPAQRTRGVTQNQWFKTGKKNWHKTQQQMRGLTKREIFCAPSLKYP